MIPSHKQVGNNLALSRLQHLDPFIHGASPLLVHLGQHYGHAKTRYPASAAHSPHPNTPPLGER